MKFKKMKIPTIKVGTHKKLVIALWVLLIGSTSFGIYKNFTAIDRHTTHEKEVIDLRLVNTSNVESFVQRFAYDYFSWNQSQDAIDKRNERLENYLTEDLQQLNKDMIRTDIPTSAMVKKVWIWHVEQHGKDFEVIFSVEQQITENEVQKSIEATYSVNVHVDDQENLVITKNPTISNKPKKSIFKPIIVESDGSVDAVTSGEINQFLETFFTLYPKATQNELAYYVANNALPVIEKDYIFAELINPIYTMDGDQVLAHVSVKYLDQDTKATQLSQFELTLKKEDNWQIVK